MGVEAVGAASGREENSVATGTAPSGGSATSSGPSLGQATTRPMTRAAAQSRARLPQRMRDVMPSDRRDRSGFRPAVASMRRRMAVEQPIYDLVLLLNPELDDDRRHKILDDVEGLITARGGELLGSHDWGARQTAYEVSKRKDAEYHLVQMHATNELLEALDHTLKITDGVLRFRVIKLSKGTPPPPDMTPAAVGALGDEAETAPSDDE